MLLDHLVRRRYFGRILIAWIASSEPSSRTIVTTSSRSCQPPGSTRPVHVRAMRRPVDQDDPLLLQDLVDDSEVASSCRVEALEFAAKRFSSPLRVDRDRIEDCGEDGGADLLRQPAEVAARLGRCLYRVRLSIASGYLVRSRGERLPAAASLRERRIEVASSSSRRIATVSSSDSRSSSLIRTAAVRP